MNAAKKSLAPAAFCCLCVLAGSMCFLAEVKGQCTRTVVGPTVTNISVLSGETVCVNNDIVVSTTVSVASGGTLIIGPRVRILTEDVYSYGIIDMGDHSYLDVQSGANFEGVGAITTMGIGATIFVCNGVNIVFGATIHMGSMSVFDSFNTTMAFSTDYFHYNGPPTGTVQAHLVARTSMIVNGALTSDSEIAYCGTSAGTNLTPTQLGAAQLYCTPLIPPAIMAAMHCSVVSPYYYAAVLPIRFETFEVRPMISGINYIRWTIEEDQTVLYYHLEKKAADGPFQIVHTLRPASALASRKTYLYNDTIKMQGLHEFQYRVRAIRRDGTSFESPVRKVTSVLRSQELTLWPNPVQDQLQIILPQTNMASNNIQLSVMNAMGVLLHKQTFSGSSSMLTIPTSALRLQSKNYYYVKIQMDNRIYVRGFSKM